MACDTMIKTAAERRAREEAIEQLAQEIAAGERTVNKNGFTGEVSISGWAETAAAKARWCEGCAVVNLAQRGDSWAGQSALAGVGVKKGASFVAASHNHHPHRVR